MVNVGSSGMKTIINVIWQWIGKRGNCLVATIMLNYCVRTKAVTQSLEGMLLKIVILVTYCRHTDIQTPFCLGYLNISHQVQHIQPECSTARNEDETMKRQYTGGRVL